MKNLFLFLLLFFTGVAASANTLNSPINKEDLVFPVAGNSSNVGSFWGAVREGGKRKHEGIDIFAKKGTPVVAIADGKITQVTTMPKGGKVVWLRCDDRAWDVYYAHLDKQLVRVGQSVKKGQALGTVGNTGNARTTPAHLHFGIYTHKGAVDPYPYVKNLQKITDPWKERIDEDVLLATNENAKRVGKATSKSPNNKAVTFPQKYIWKTIDFASDPSSEYYITTRANVVKVNKGAYEVIGKMQRNRDANYPYSLQLANSESMYLERSGRLLTTDGKEVGKVL